MRKARVYALAIVSALVASSLHASAQAPATAQLPPPPLALTVTPAAGGGSWRLKIENTGDVPVRIAADPRLLVLEVTPPAGFVDETATKPKAKAGAAPPKAEEPKPVRCILPSDARPTTDEGRDLVIPSKRSWSVAIDPLLYCFGAHERTRLVAGATVKPHFGWPAPVPKPGARPKAVVAPPAPPFVAAPVGAAIGRIAPAKELEGATFTLADSTPGSSRPPAATSPTSGGLVVSVPDTMDVAKGTEISTTVTITNEGDKAAVVLARPEMLRFSVATPAGSVACGTTRLVASPIRELYSTVGVKGRTSITVLLTAVCPADTFDEAGIYRVTPVLDTSGASGREVGLKTWDGIAEGRIPMLLRVRSARRPAQATRPALD